MNAHREDASRHGEYRQWLESTVTAEAPFGVADAVLSGFLRIVTHPRVFTPPTPVATAFAFADDLRSHPRAVVIAPGERHWSIFRRLCAQVSARGNLVSDAYLAALAIESGSEWITDDRDFARFPGLRWRHPLDG